MYGAILDEFLEIGRTFFWERHTIISNLQQISSNVWALKKILKNPTKSKKKTFMFSVKDLIVLDLPLQRYVVFLQIFS